MCVHHRWCSTRDMTHWGSAWFCRPGCRCKRRPDVFVRSRCAIDVRFMPEFTRWSFYTDVHKPCPSLDFTARLGLTEPTVPTRQVGTASQTPWRPLCAEPTTDHSLSLSQLPTRQAGRCPFRALRKNSATSQGWRRLCRWSSKECHSPRGFSGRWDNGHIGDTLALADVFAKTDKDHAADCIAELRAASVHADAARRNSCDSFSNLLNFCRPPRSLLFAAILLVGAHVDIFSQECDHYRRLDCRKRPNGLVFSEPWS